MQFSLYLDQCQTPSCVVILKFDENNINIIHKGTMQKSQPLVFTSFIRNFLDHTYLCNALKTSLCNFGVAAAIIRPSQSKVTSSPFQPVTIPPAPLITGTKAMAS